MKNLLLITLIMFVQSSLCLSQTPDFTKGVEPTAGSWQPWVISSVKAVPVPPPPSKEAAKAELNGIITLQKQIDSSMLADIHYWNAGPPAYRWQKVADNLWDSSQYWVRVNAYMHVAIYDATLAAWNAKYEHKRIRPFEASKSIKNIVTEPLSPAYPCEHAVTAGAAATVLAYMFPDKADSLMALGKRAGRSRIAAGLQYPSDVEAGFALGVKVAEIIIAETKQDGFDKPWPGKVPKGREYDSGKPLTKDLTKLKTWVLKDASQFRSPLLFALVGPYQ